MYIYIYITVVGYVAVRKSADPREATRQNGAAHNAFAAGARATCR